MEDYINQQSRILPPTIPLIPKLKRGHDPLTDRLSSKLLGTLNLSHVDSEAMAEFRAKQPSKRYRRALDRASSSLTPLPEDREVKPRAPQRNAKVQNDMPDREGGNERSKRAPVVLQEAGIPAKTFRAVMRLVLGLPLVAAAPRVRMQAPRKRPPVWAEVCPFTASADHSPGKSYARLYRTIAPSNPAFTCTNARPTPTYSTDTLHRTSFVKSR